jgi:hypothetical protein
MVNLPFVVQPRRQPILERIGSEDSGIIEVERRGYLTSGEKSFVQQVQQFDNGTTEIVTLSRRVARQYGLGMDRAYNLVLAIISGQDATGIPGGELIGQIEQEFAEELTGVVKGLAAGQAREDMVFAACLLRYRIDPEYDIGDVAKLHPDLIAGLAALYRDEERRSLEAFKKEEDSNTKQPTIEEAEKKPVRGSKSRSTSSITD